MRGAGWKSEDVIAYLVTHRLKLKRKALARAVKRKRTTPTKGAATDADN